MSRSFVLEIQSKLAGDADVVWDSVGCMAGVNYEMAPWIRMGYPKSHANFHARTAYTDEVLFKSILYFRGWIPFDVHSLVLESITEQPLSFQERSHSWLQQSWRHFREVSPVDGGSLIRDVVECAPRFSWLYAFSEFVVSAMFSYRHRRLVARYGGDLGEVIVRSS